MRLIILFILFTSNILAQKDLGHALVVRVNPSFLDTGIINNKNSSGGIFFEFCNKFGKLAIDSINKKYNCQLGEIKLEKLFLSMQTYDTISIGRQGQKVVVPPFWATFTFYFSNLIELKEYKLILDNSYPLIAYSHRFFELEFESVPNDTYYDFQKGLKNNSIPNADIKVDEAWDIETGKRFIKVGVFDSGIDSSHEDLEVLSGCICYENNGFLDYSFGSDKLGHGTSVAGIIAAKRNNNIGISGIAGGDGSDSSGVSLLDFRLTDSIGTFSRFGVGVGLIDASRRVGTYYDWVQDDPLTLSELQNQSNPGYGIHIANHSYNLKVYPFNRPSEIGVGDSIFIDDVDEPTINECYLCREAFLFSLKNGVINVVSRGNRTSSAFTNIGIPKVPTIYDDSWIISVGSSDISGDFIDSVEYLLNGYTSYIGRSVDLIAPGTKSTVYTTKSTHLNTGLAYRHFNGTSAAAPHASGVAALLLSKYNKPCYSNINLDPADVEYILQKSASDLKTANYDDSTGWGRLNAKKALDMIDFPNFQIIHPQNTPSNIELLELDTIHIYLNQPIYEECNGPIGTNFTPPLNKFYKAKRYHYELTYDFSNYITNNTQLVDSWVRYSQTNSALKIQDTSYTLGILGNTGQLTNILHVDTFTIEPYAYITNVDTLNSTIKLNGYYYNFINQMDNQFSNVINNLDFWYPLNPFLNTPNLAFSIYIFDSTLTSRYDFPCDSSNLLVDPTIGIINTFSQEINIYIYPNPSTGQIKIEALNNPLNGQLKLTNLEGRDIYNVEIINKKDCVLNFENLPNGVYFIEFQSGKNKISKKWIKL